MGKVIGIDLGTTNSCMAFTENGHTTVILNREGRATTPSVVAFDKQGQRLVGESAKHQAALNPDNTIISIKREMGTAWKKRINGKTYIPQEISAMILQKLKMDAEDYLGEKISEAVITVPAYFNDDQRQATKDAGRIAGLNVLRIINEPTAAALAYGLENDYGQKVLVFDLGGGTFDVSIIEIGNGVIEVLSTSGDNRLGGDDFDAVLAEYIAASFAKDTGIDLRRDKVAMSRIIEAAEKAKIELSFAGSATVMLPFITNDAGIPRNLEMTITREKFNALTGDLVERTVIPVQNALNDAMVGPEHIDKAIMVGGSSRIPAVNDRLARILGKQPSHALNPDECVAMGAAVQGAKLSGQLIVSNLPGETRQDVLLLDVTPLTLSIETIGGVATPLIPRNTTIPASHSQIFTTAANFQTSVDVNVLQGERPLAKDNKCLGQFRLKHIKRAMRGVPQIEVTFDIDANGLVHISARDLSTGSQESITIESAIHMSESEIDRAVREARQYEAEDRRQRERITFRNDAESLLFRAEKALAEDKKTMDRESYRQLKDAESDLRKAMRKYDPEKDDDNAYETARAAYEKLKNINFNGNG